MRNAVGGSMLALAKRGVWHGRGPDSRRRGGGHGARDDARPGRPHGHHSRAGRRTRSERTRRRLGQLGAQRCQPVPPAPPLHGALPRDPRRGAARRGRRHRTRRRRARQSDTGRPRVDHRRRAPRRRALRTPLRAPGRGRACRGLGGRGHPGLAVRRGVAVAGLLATEPSRAYRT